MAPPRFRLVVATLALGCRRDEPAPPTIAAPASSSAVASSSPSSSTASTASTPSAAPSVLGACRAFEGPSTPCPAGSACLRGPDGVTASCVGSSQAYWNVPCGVLTCVGTTCVDPTRSICEAKRLQAIKGPLPPPDLAHA